MPHSSNFPQYDKNKTKFLPVCSAALLTNLVARPGLGAAVPRPGLGAADGGGSGRALLRMLPSTVGQWSKG